MFLIFFYCVIASNIFLKKYSKLFYFLVHIRINKSINSAPPSQSWSLRNSHSVPNQIWLETLKAWSTPSLISEFFKFFHSYSFLIKEFIEFALIIQHFCTRKQINISSFFAIFSFG